MILPRLMMSRITMPCKNVRNKKMAKGNENASKPDISKRIVLRKSARWVCIARWQKLDRTKAA